MEYEKDGLKMVDLESITDQIVTVSLVTKTEFWGLITELGKTIFKTCWKRLDTFSSLTEITISYERLFFLFSVLQSCFNGGLNFWRNLLPEMF